MRSEFIQTSIRPIKKLFIIDDFNYISFENIFLKIKNEIDIIQNLLFVNNNELWSQANTALSLTSCINYGLYQDDIKDLLQLSIFKNLEELMFNINTIMNHENLDIPAFIINGDILFNQNQNNISNYFELRDRDTFLTGAILVEELKDETK